MSIFAPFTFIAPEEIAAPAPPAASYLNDVTSSLAMYSVVRKLDGEYTGSAYRVRRTPDNLEQDIGFSGDLVDTASLSSFCGANDGFITTWYDQSGNGHNLTQTTAVLQPFVYETGSVATISSSVDIPAINFQNYSSAHYLVNTSFINTSKAEFHSVMNILQTDIGGNAIFIGNPDNGWSYGGYQVPSGDTSIIKSDGGRVAQLTIGNNTYALTNVFYNVNGGTNASFNFTNGSSATTTLVTGNFSAATFGKIWIGSATFDPTGFRQWANMSEIAFYWDTAGERSNVRDNINNYYSIY